MKEFEEMGLLWGKAQAKAEERVQWWGMTAALYPSWDEEDKLVTRSTAATGVSQWSTSYKCT